MGCVRKTHAPLLGFFKLCPCAYELKRTLMCASSSSSSSTTTDYYEFVKVYSQSQFESVEWSSTSLVLAVNPRTTTLGQCYLPRSTVHDKDSHSKWVRKYSHSESYVVVGVLQNAHVIDWSSVPASWCSMFATQSSRNTHFVVKGQLVVVEGGRLTVRKHKPNTMQHLFFGSARDIL